MIFFQFTAVFLSCHSLYFYFAKNTINNLAETLTDILNGSLGSLTGVYLDTTQLYHDLDLLKGVQDIGGATYTAATTLNPDGTMVEANLDQGLGPILTQNVSDILKNLKTSINNLHAEGTGLPGIALAPLINTTLEPLKAAATAAIDGLLTPLLGGTDPTGVVDTLTQQLLTASVLGDTTVKIPTTIDIPATSTGVVDSKFVGTVAQTDLLDVDLLITANGVSDVFWAGQAPADTTAPAAPVITSTTGNSTTGYTVTGTAEPNSTVNIYDASDALVGTAATDEERQLHCDLAGYSGCGCAQLTATATDAAGNESPETAFTTPADLRHNRSRRRRFRWRQRHSLHRDL
ncbi:MAG: adhesive domain-containing protein [Syntrophomonadaceae bacterium]